MNKLDHYDPTLTPPLRRRLEATLEPDERVCWVGMPSARGMAIREALKSGGTLLLLLVLGSFVAALLLLIGDVTFPWTASGVLLGLLCLVLALNVYWAKWQAKRTVYVVTDRRAMIVQAGAGGRPYVFPREKLGAAIVHRLPDGAGEIIFEEQVLTSIWSNPECSSNERTCRYAVGFIELDDVAGPREALEQLLGQPVPVKEVQSVEVRDMPPGDRYA